MPKYRVPFSGAVLVETDEPSAADIYAGIWSAAVLQLTHGLPPQKIINVRAVYFDFDSQQIEDVSKGLEVAGQRYFQLFVADRDPISLQLQRATDLYHSEIQNYFEFYEQDCRDS